MSVREIVGHFPLGKLAGLVKVSLLNTANAEVTKHSAQRSVVYKCGRTKWKIYIQRSY